MFVQTHYTSLYLAGPMFTHYELGEIEVHATFYLNHEGDVIVTTQSWPVLETDGYFVCPD